MLDKNCAVYGPQLFFGDEQQFSTYSESSTLKERRGTLTLIFRKKNPISVNILVSNRKSSKGLKYYSFFTTLGLVCI